MKVAHCGSRAKALPSAVVIAKSEEGVDPLSAIKPRKAA